MEYYENYLNKMEAGGNDTELLAELRQEAIQSLRDDPPERALTMTGQMVAALLLAAKRQEPPDPLMMDAINDVTNLVIKYLENIGWRFRAYKTADGWKYESSFG